MYSSSSVKDFTIGPATIPNTDVQTESILHPLNPVKHLAYLCQFSQDDFTVVRPLNRANLECWSNEKKVNEITSNDLLVTIEVIKDKIILGIDADIDARMIRLGIKLLLESADKLYDLGMISEVNRFIKKVPFPKKSPTKHVSSYTIIFNKFVKMNRLAFDKSKFDSIPLFNFQNLQGEAALKATGELLQGKHRYSNSYGNTLEGTFNHGILICGTVTLSDGTILEGTFNGHQGSLQGLGKLISSEISCEGSFENGKLIKGKKIWPNKNWQEGTFEGEGKQIDQDGVTSEGWFAEGTLVEGKKNWPDGLMILQRGGIGERIKSIIPGCIRTDYSYPFFSYDCNSEITPHNIDRWTFSPYRIIGLNCQRAARHLNRNIRTFSSIKSRSEKNKNFLNSLQELIVNYLKGEDVLVDVNETNALIVLKTAKVIDILIKRAGFLNSLKLQSTYLIRKAALRNALIRVNTAEVYTYSLNPEDYNSLEYLINPMNWINERIAQQAKLIIDYNILCRSLSGRMKSVVIATRGNTGVGKSYSLERSLIKHLLPKYLKEHLNQHDHIVHGDGVLNPDYVKAILKNLDGQPLLNGQVYLEGRVVFARYLGQLTENASEVVGAVIDTRLLTVEDFREVLAFSQVRRAKLEIMDVEASIWCSILSVLNREPFGSDPCVSFEVIKDGYIRARANRGEFIHASSCERVNYSLYRLDKDGRYVRVVRKGEDDDYPTIMSQSAFDDCLQVPSEGEMNGVAYRVITEELIQSLEVPRNKEVLRQWIGYTVKDALKMHSKGEKPCLVA